ncbi:MAG: hypothetical protein H6766_07745 [Candidatus Peribacteria bacterium]|nr:MAG: hypothetical protein H6766_07745 [Candidatus Peribacteria bacterium]
MVEYSNTFDLLPAVERQHLLDTRAVLNQTFMDMSLDDLQKRFFVASHPED